MKNQFILFKSDLIIDDPILKSIFSSKTAELGQGKWNTLLNQHQKLSIISWDTTWLRLFQNYNENILKEISHIKFSFLEIINLTHNNFSSMEGIHRIHMPELKRIYLKSNFILKLKPLTKSYWKQFENLSIENNKLVDGFELAKMKIQKLEVIRFQDTNVQEHCPDLSFLLKLQTKKLYSLNINNAKRISQKEMRKVLKKKYVNIA